MTKYLVTNSTGAQIADIYGVTSTNSDGFALGPWMSNIKANANGVNYAAWNWKKGTTP